MKYTFVCLLLCVGICRSLTSAKVLPLVKNDIRWSYLVLAQFWPESSCIYFQERGDQCYIPPGIKGWTIHGLWPSTPNPNDSPHNCNDSMVFNMTQIEVLRPKLDLEWHFYKKGNDTSFLWNHEWTKHGTCAYSLPDLQGELKYFNKTLELHSHLNFTAVLANSDIVPSHTDTYKREDFFDAVQKYYNVKPFIVCDWNKKEKKAYIDQIYLCYNKTFNLQDCYPTSSKTTADATKPSSSFYENCEEQDNIYYLPYNGNNRKMSQKETGKSLVFRSENANTLKINPQ